MTGLQICDLVFFYIIFAIFVFDKAVDFGLEPESLEHFHADIIFSEY